MKKHLLIIASIATGATCSGQEVIASAGQTNQAGLLTVSQTVGEVVIQSYENSIELGQGFHQQELILTSVNTPIEELKVSVYPNPFANSINIASKTDLELISLYDMEGSVIQNLQEPAGNTAIRIDLSELSSGSYILYARAADSQLENTYKIIKQ